jgi:hypothetical protein
LVSSSLSSVLSAGVIDGAAFFGAEKKSAM